MIQFHTEFVAAFKIEPELTLNGKFILYLHGWRLFSENSSIKAAHTYLCYEQLFTKMTKQFLTGISTSDS